jgi:hypothetical protein
MGGVDYPPHLRWVVEGRVDVWPVAPPGLGDWRIGGYPLLLELIQPLFGIYSVAMHKIKKLDLSKPFELIVYTERFERPPFTIWMGSYVQSKAAQNSCGPPAPSSGHHPSARVATSRPLSLALSAWYSTVPELAFAVPGDRWFV